jgi:small subunit ribosomal protein S16
MAVKIRLARTGKKHVPFYRIVAIDSRRARDGKALEIIGSYDALESRVMHFDQEKFTAWVTKGAIVTDAVKKIQKRHIAASHG